MAWLRSTATLQIAVPAAVALEMVIGSQHKADLKRTDRFLLDFDVLPFAKGDYEKAYDLVLKHRLAAGLGLGDFLIAAQALNRGATLYTFNLRHFGTIPNLDARAPYSRTPPARP